MVQAHQEEASIIRGKLGRRYSLERRLEGNGNFSNATIFHFGGELKCLFSDDKWGVFPSA